jgi:alkylation response protein AidB-like acyl-CoA dehydrogenase
MQFELNSEQQLLNDSVSRFIEKEYSFDARSRRLAERETQPDAWRLFAENGWLAAALPEQYGGLGGSIIDTAIICRQLGRGLVLEPYLGCAVLATQTFAAAGNEAQLDAWLPGVGDGSRRIALAHSEGSHGMTDRMTTRAEPTHSGYRLTGRKALVLGGAGADAFVVSAGLNKREGASDLGLFLVAADASGLKVASIPLHDGQLAAELTIDDVIGEPIGAVGGGIDALREGLAHGVIALCSELVGSMERVVEITADYIRTRKQFDVALASFQALQHRMADMAAELELARSMLFVALASFQNDRPARRQAVLSAAKAFVSRAALNVCGQGIQLHGAIGMTEEYSVGHYFKRAVIGGLLLGANTVHEAATAAALQSELAIAR